MSIDKGASWEEMQIADLRHRSQVLDAWRQEAWELYVSKSEEAFNVGHKWLDLIEAATGDRKATHEQALAVIRAMREKSEAQ